MAPPAPRARSRRWSRAGARICAARPLSLTELGSLLTGISYPSVERRLGAMRLAGQVEAMPGQGKGTPYTVIPWLRQAVGPLLAAARWETWHLGDEVRPIGGRDAEAAFLLAVPPVELPADCSGRCRMAIETGSGEQAGVTVGIKQGKVLSCVSRLEGPSDAWVVGPSDAWFAAMIERAADRLELRGETRLASELIEGLHEELFGMGARSLP